MGWQLKWWKFGKKKLFLFITIMVLPPGILSYIIRNFFMSFQSQFSYNDEYACFCCSWQMLLGMSMLKMINGSEQKKIPNYDCIFFVHRWPLVIWIPKLSFAYIKKWNIFYVNKKQKVWCIKIICDAVFLFYLLLKR